MRPWEDLTERIERHRLQYPIDVERDGPLGPSPSGVRSEERDRYERVRGRLAEEIDKVRSDRGMPEDSLVRKIAHESRQLPVDLAREL
jgi:hypothetical protein